MSSPNPFFALAGMIDKGLNSMKKRAEHRDVLAHLDYAHQKQLEAMSHQAGLQQETIRVVAGEAAKPIAGGGKGRVEHGPEGTRAEFDVPTPAPKPAKKTAKKTAAPKPRAPKGQGTLFDTSGKPNPKATARSRKSAGK